MNPIFIVGGGYIGLEMADALTRKGMAVTLLEFAPEVLTTLDPEIGALIRAKLQSKGVRVITGQAVQRILRNEIGLSVHTAADDTVAADIVLAAVGARPSAELAKPPASAWEPERRSRWTGAWPRK